MRDNGKHKALLDLNDRIVLLPKTTKKFRLPARAIRFWLGTIPECVMSLEKQLEKLYYLKRDKSSGYEKPYKPVLLLALMDLIGEGHFAQNQIPLTDDLIQRYRAILSIVGREKDRGPINYPFWHLAGDETLWTLWGKDRQTLYRKGENAQSSPSVKWIRERLGHASLDPELFALLSNPSDRALIREALVCRYFPQHRNALLPSESYPTKNESEGTDQAVAEEAPPPRSAAFAKTVKEVYDYRCAASGLRFRFGDLTMVDACHLIPFASSHNDHPSNGIALSKNHHWAFDHALIAPQQKETKLVWAVSPRLDDRIPEHKALLDLDGRSVLLPKDKRFFPADTSLQWRWERLLR